MIKERLYAFLDKLAGRQNWLLLSAILLTAVSLFFAFPSYNDIDPQAWEPFFQKAATPFLNSPYPADTHINQLTFRLFMPLLVHYTHLRITGLMILYGVVGIANFYLVVKIADGIFKDKRTALLIGLCSAFIYFGKCSFTEIRGEMFDGVTMFFLLLAIVAKPGVLKGLFIFLSAWTDERGLIASCLVWLFIIISSQEKNIIKRLFSPGVLFIYISWICYFAGRYFLIMHYGLHTGNGPALWALSFEMNNMPIGIWSALEGLWILVIYSWVLLYRNKQYFELFLYLLFTAIILFISFCVWDITRSVMYLFPAVFISLKIIKDKLDVQVFNRLLWLALILCFVYPAYYSGGKNQIWWSYPLPLQLLRFIYA